MGTFLVFNFTKTILILVTCSSLGTSDTNLWDSLISAGVNPILDPVAYERALCSVQNIECYCSEDVYNPADCEKCRISKNANSGYCWKECDSCECLGKPECYYEDSKSQCYASDIFSTNQDYAVPKCPKATLEPTPCAFRSGKYLLMFGGVCFRAQESVSNYDCSPPETFLAINLNGANIEASNGILYDMNDTTENVLKGRSNQPIYIVNEDDQEVKIHDMDQTLYGTWLFDIQLNGIVVAAAIDAAKMNSGRICERLNVALYFYVKEDEEGFRQLYIDGKRQTQIKDKVMSVAFCNSPSQILTKGTIINGFSVFKYEIK